MSRRPPHDEPETRSVAADDATLGRYSLVVIGPAGIATLPLPPTGRLVIGRSQTADLHIADPSISRTHAVLDMGPPLRVSDAGSHNGVVVRQTRLAPDAPVEITPGEVLRMGALTVLVQYGVAPPVAPTLGAPATGDAGAQAAAYARAVQGVVLGDPVMVRLYELLARVARSELSVLLLGETGVGKEVLADALHRASRRAAGPLVRVNCAALTPSLLESELFGHEKGAFTGAVAARAGLFEAAVGGTVFLDEVGELPLETQVKLLRVIEERRVTRVGSVASRPIDVRFVAATHRDVRARVASGAFREDLFFRLNGISIEVPPLRARVGEVLPLAELFLSRTSAQLGIAPPTITDAARRLLECYPWPGNARELRNAIERAAVLAADGPILPEHLPPEIASAPGAPRAAPRVIASAARGASAPSAGGLRGDLEALEKQRILDALEQCGGNQSRAAAQLGMRRGTLLARLDAWGIARPRKGNE